ncbi:MAG: T9SS type A sorting domain-containing protein [Saprospirales bacterium]|nr:T9SS type A sorting domain-containing protein [Saprospirales bacterium]
MKNLFYLFGPLFLSLSLAAQPCLPDGITFTTQQEIDDFPSLYSGCTEIEGNVEIVGADITNLNGLAGITSIKGNFKIHDNALLESLAGMDNLTAVEGSLMLWGNNGLVNLHGLEGLTTVQHHLAIGSNPDTCLCPVGNYALTSLSGLEGLTFVGGGLYIQKNILLPDLSGLDNLVTVGGDLMLGDNTMLSSMTGLEGLTSIGGTLSIGIYTPEIPHGNANLLNLNGLDNVTSIGGNFSVLRNLLLNDISALNHAISIGGDLTIGQNSALPECAVEAICDYLSTPNGVVDIQSNATGCNSSMEVETACTVNVEEDLSAQTWVVFPNPSAGIFVVKGGEGILTVRDATGQQVQVQAIKNEAQVDLTNHPAGVYFLEVRTDIGLEVKKVLRR